MVKWQKSNPVLVEKSDGIISSFITDFAINNLGERDIFASKYFFRYVQKNQWFATHRSGGFGYGSFTEILPEIFRIGYSFFR